MGALTSGITHAVRKHCYERDNYCCQNPRCPNLKKQSAFRWVEKLQRWVQKKLHLHHCFWRSRYHEEDVNDPWNLCTLCDDCHNLLHTPPPERAEEGKQLEQWCIDLAAGRKAGYNVGGLDIPRERKRSLADKERQRQHRKNAYRSSMQRYKDQHNGLSPSQVQYRKLKELRKS